MDSIYNNIESFLNDATIDKILKIYEDSNNFYYYGTISNGSKNREEYTNEYNKYVIYENVTRIINNLKNQNVDEYNNKFLKRKQIGINKENGEEAKKQISKKFDILYF
ncbi:MAG: hypothetical protein IJ094_05295 [Bacilli bacterium]|nr:hypothetical protein [Bacilli bacterium]